MFSYLVVFIVMLSCFLHAFELVPYRVNDTWGYADPQGHLVYEPAFREAHPSCQGMMRVRTQQEWGFISSWGRWMFSTAYGDL